ncbi:response regulator [Geomonas sp. RF6]|uniref:response regulator n=1 Tax=Geomonas sp. RF6 TaxID=2897342 RepID=UPI001E3CD0BB|nr:response regulator [Geomonas sp. RF6]UFS68845.1 response regulator [Geomonas sp. RF6]
MTVKVLVVDDVSMFVELQKDFLQASAATIFTARDGAEALRVAKRERPDLIFMDLHMPVMNGAESCAAIKSDPMLRGTRVVLITSEGKDKDKAVCMAAGCDGFLTKPLDKEIFMEMARQLLPAVDRRGKRLNCRMKANFRIFGLTLSGHILDISDNGAYLATSHELEKNVLLEMVFPLPDPDGAIIQTKGRVAWLNTSKNRHKHSQQEGVGIEFTDLSPECARALARYIKRQTI